MSGQARLSDSRRPVHCGLKQMARPRTAVRGNLTAAIGMLLAILVTFRELIGSESGESLPAIAIALLVGSLVGGVLAVRIEMTAMPQLVALFNGFGGAASALVAGSEVTRASVASTPDILIASALSESLGQSRLVAA